MATPFFPKKEQFPKPLVLTECANGVFTEEGIFCPYFIANTTLSAVSGIRYYLKSATACHQLEGIQASSSIGVTVTINQTASKTCRAILPAMTLATDYSCITAQNSNINLLGDVNTPLTMDSGLSCIVARIPDKGGE